ncbi:hypothetical protein [Aeromicrobium sp. UC242_57]|uniref:hypothetical protein n=1 Tax=Aeromicrobium sp. UC242_57 TaxID=3374624 RepID=UPI00378FE4EE
MIKLVLSSVRHNLGRYLATLVAIIAGVGFYTAVSVISDGVIDSLEGNIDDQYGNVDVAVVPDDPATVESTGAQPDQLKVPQSAVDQPSRSRGSTEGPASSRRPSPSRTARASRSPPRPLGGCGSLTRISTRSQSSTVKRPALPVR